MESQRVALAHKWFKANETFDVDRVMALITGDFTVSVLPASLGFPAVPRAHLPRALESVKSKLRGGKNKKELLRIIDAPDASGGGGTIVVHARSVDTFMTDGTPYLNEYMITIIMKSEGERLLISHVTEFADSACIQAASSVQHALSVDHQ
ncbi:hypothetical protein EXIGLDRAFT_766360 [Exidia glandulosa HHB12029]|uniref:SnoaL-like domain-containing protein n=1 Tax=Exidia glandulosa HHB12029 TaxID=1314781 RepID=A0A166AU67_EXIGL|nr:hypothetical protein EXIGLDRAFT_766360 [Exidia glandulosa HHB12029]